MFAFPLTDAEGRELERLARRHNLTTMEIMIEMGEIIRKDFSAEHDQSATGPVFTFTRNHVVGPDYFASANVPEPAAVVDLFEARFVCSQDQMCASVLLEGKRSRELGRDILANVLAWARFWAARFPSPEGRARYQALPMNSTSGRTFA